MKLLLLAAIFCLVAADGMWWFRHGGQKAEDCKEYEALQSGAGCDAETCEGLKPCPRVLVNDVCLCREGLARKPDGTCVPKAGCSPTMLKTDKTN